MIRKLELKDFSYMYEWMKDKAVTEHLQADFANFSEEQVLNFINKSMNQELSDDNLNFAIVNEMDEYMGTISLKNIDRKHLNAEYAIVTRKTAHGRGYARSATYDILDFGFNQIGLEKIYLYVSEDNIAANKFYNKVGFIQEGVFRKHMMIGGKLRNIKWYSVLKDEFARKE